MSKLISNGIELEYEIYGSPEDPPLLLIGGWSVQLTFWPQAFVNRLTSAGFRVIVFDNRDAGLSQKMSRFPPTSPFAPHVMAARLLRSRRLTAYTLEDMADDAAGLLDALDIDYAHILGLSMGGMITQILAAKYPKLVNSVTILMSTTNRFGLPQPSIPLGLDVFFAPSSRRKSKQLRRSQRVWRKIRTQDGGYDETAFDANINATIDRSYSPAGRRRQMEAIFASGDLTRWTKAIRAPALVIHGSDDRLARPHGGLDIAANIPGSKFELIEGMGHDLAPNRIKQIASLIVSHLRNTEKPKKKPAANASG